ncbi:serine hydrolase [Actinobacillus delphinicola]|uniref:serine-type D-Ala-D-Ala carboxypeptidase n=1 Tax=Actinobacillus delphinicola TaxID=51161 RepID=A0A448TTC2_9PAST|nr:serine hydrolase [Actinobacillus delphinicola]VEJ09073.1 Serine-type D-Ala-D-Ala carboxypeptidase [Actinobacillus delphinicola]
MFKHWIKTTTATALCGLCAFPAIAAQDNSVAAPSALAPVTAPAPATTTPTTDAVEFGIAPPQLDSRSYILMDYNSGAILAEKNSNQREAPASLTKMMTSYVIGQALKQGKIHNDDIVTVPADAWGGNKALHGSSLMFLRIGQKVPVSELNRGIIVDSGNDACITMAEYVSGSQNTFVQSMNRYVQQMGLKNTHFMTVHGLDHENQYSSSHDMAIIAKHLIKDLPQEYKLYSIKKLTFNNITQSNRNGLLWDTSMHVDGLKTGHTDEAGYNLVASAVGDNNMRLISVVMGTPSKQAREQESKQLLRWGFANFETLRALIPGKPILEEPVYYGDTDKVALGTLENTYLTLPKGRRPDIKIRYELAQNPLKAPLMKGQVVGKVIYQLDGRDIASINLQVLQDVKEGGVFSRLWDWIVLNVKSLF